MAGSNQPYLYDSDRQPRGLPSKPFDPKAVTRASWEPRPMSRKKQDGPLVSFNRHPDLHEVPTVRSAFRSMSNRTKAWIIWLRRVQLGLRSLELIAALGLLTLMILISNVNDVTAWIMRISSGVIAMNCAYGVWHHIRPAGSRTPASSAAYHIFAGFADLAALPFYTYGAWAVHTHSQTWTTLLADQTLLNYFVPAYFYTLIAAGGLHLVSLSISLWLALMFRRITNMPPDMNPLEDHLTTRAHKRNKSSISTNYTAATENSNRLSTPLEDRRRSGAPYETLTRPPSIPFMHTRSGSRDSAIASPQDLPTRQYGVQPSNSPRNSVTSMDEVKRLSKPASGRGSYTEVPLHEAGSSRPSSMIDMAAEASQARQAKFTEAWYASESLINRTQQRQRAMNAAATSAVAAKTRAYEALVQRYDADSDDDSDEENRMRPDPADVSDLDDSIIGGGSHPNPLRSNPTPTASVVSTAPTVPPHGTAVGNSIPRSKTPYYAPRGKALDEISSNPRSNGAYKGLVEQKSGNLGIPKVGRNRDSSIQSEDAFYSKPYGDLRPATPPVVVGSGRQVSSGNDFDFGLGLGDANKGYTGYRRNVSGKVAEEGLAGKRMSRYAILNDD